MNFNLTKQNKLFKNYKIINYKCNKTNMILLTLNNRH